MSDGESELAIERELSVLKARVRQLEAKLHARGASDDASLSGVSHKAISEVLRRYLHEGWPLAELVADCGVEESALQDMDRWMSWADYCAIVDTAHQRYGEEGWWQLGSRLFELPEVRLFKLVSWVVSNEETLLRWMVAQSVGPGSLMYRCVEGSVDTEPGGIVIRLVCPTEPPPGLSLQLAAAIAHVPVLFGRSVGRVDTDIDGCKLEMRLYRDPGNGLSPGQRFWRWFARSDAEEVKRAYDALLDRNRELSEQLVTIREADRDREALQKRLREAERLESLGRLAGGIAHDFNNLLTVLSMHLDLLQMDGALNPQDLVHVDGMRDVVGRATGLVSQLLAFGGQQMLAPKVVDLRTLVEGMVPLLRSLVGEQVTLSVESGPGIQAARIDPRQLERVVLNLVSNAGDAVSAGGEVRIRLETRMLKLGEARELSLQEGYYVEMSVADTGHGMPPEVIQRALEPFFTTKEIGKGTGLGLSTTYGIVQQFGGQLKLRSEVGDGTVATLFFPWTDEPLDETPSYHSLAMRRASNQVRVLVVEDDTDLRELLGDMMSAVGYRPVLAANGEEALHRLSEREVDLVLTDIRMPGLSGYQLGRIIRHRYPHLPIVLMSGYAMVDADAAEQRDLDVAGFLQKPFHHRDLIATLDKVLDDTDNPVPGPT